MRWSLDDYYVSFEDAGFLGDIKKVEEMITQIEKRELPAVENLDAAERAAIIEKFYKQNSELSHLVSRLLGFCSLTLSVETDNTIALSHQQKLQQKLIRLTKPSVRFRSWFASKDDLDEILKHSDYLKEIEFSLRDTLKMFRYLLSEKEEDSSDKKMEMTIEDLELSVRSYNSLKRAGITTVEELTQKSEEDMMTIRNLGRKSLKEVKDKLESLGLVLRNN
jgi:DNA-directed RNA polymerase alpha subunit